MVGVVLVESVVLCVHQRAGQRACISAWLQFALQFAHPLRTVGTGVQRLQVDAVLCRTAWYCLCQKNDGVKMVLHELASTPNLEWISVAFHAAYEGVPLVDGRVEVDGAAQQHVASALVGAVLAHSLWRDIVVCQFC